MYIKRKVLGGSVSINPLLGLLLMQHTSSQQPEKMVGSATPPAGSNWTLVTDAELDATTILRWATTPACGAVVNFSGVVREHSAEGGGVEQIDYEAYTEHVIASFDALIVQARDQWPDIQKAAIHHRTGPVKLGETSVNVAVSTPHRGEAFAAAQFLIDTLKADAPIWKKEIRS